MLFWGNVIFVTSELPELKVLLVTVAEAGPSFCTSRLLALHRYCPFSLSFWETAWPEFWLKFFEFHQQSKPILSQKGQVEALSRDLVEWDLCACKKNIKNVLSVKVKNFISTWKTNLEFVSWVCKKKEWLQLTQIRNVIVWYLMHLQHFNGFALNPGSGLNLKEVGLGGGKSGAHTSKLILRFSPRLVISVENKYFLQN